MKHPMLSVAVSAVLIGMAFGACSSEERRNFGQGEISDDGGSVRTWTALVDGNTACVEVSNGAEACIDLETTPVVEIDMKIDVANGSSALVGITPPGTRSVAVRFADGAAQSVATEPYEAGGLMFAWAIDFSVESVPVAIRALNGEGSVLDEVTTDLAHSS